MPRLSMSSAKKTTRARRRFVTSSALSPRRPRAPLPDHLAGRGRGSNPVAGRRRDRLTPSEGSRRRQAPPRCSGRIRDESEVRPRHRLPDPCTPATLSPRTRALRRNDEKPLVDPMPRHCGKNSMVFFPIVGAARLPAPDADGRRLDCAHVSPLVPPPAQVSTMLLPARMTGVVHVNSKRQLVRQYPMRRERHRSNQRCVFASAGGQPRPGSPGG